MTFLPTWTTSFGPEGPSRLLSPDVHSRITPLTNCYEAGWNGNLKLSESPLIGSNATSPDSCGKSPNTATSFPSETFLFTAMTLLTTVSCGASSKKNSAPSLIQWKYCCNRRQELTQTSNSCAASIACGACSAKLRQQYPMRMYVQSAIDGKLGLR